MVRVSAQLRLEFQQWTRSLDDRGHVARMQERISQRTRHLLIYFGNHAPRATDCCQGAVDSNAQAQIPPLVRRRSLHERHINRHRARADKIFDLSQEDRGVVGTASCHRLAHVCSKEQAVVAEMPFMFRPNVVSVAERQHVDYLYAAELARPFRESAYQRHGCGASRMNVNAVTGSHPLRPHVRRAKLSPKFVKPTHACTPTCHGHVGRQCESHKNDRFGVSFGQLRLLAQRITRLAASSCTDAVDYAEDTHVLLNGGLPRLIPEGG